MQIHSMKLAQALPNSSSLIIFNGVTKDKRANDYEITAADRGYFEVKVLTGKDAGEVYLVFPTNISYVKLVKEDKKTAGRPKKVE